MPRLAAACTWPGATWQKLRSDLWLLVAICSGPGCTWEWLYCEQRPAATRAQFGATYQEFQSTPKSAAVCLSLWTFERFQESPQCKLPNYIDQLLKKICVGHMIGYSECRENHQGQARVVLAGLMESSDMAPTCSCRICDERAQQRNKRAYQHFSPRESCPSSPVPEARPFSFSLHVPTLFELLSLHWSLG